MKDKHSENLLALQAALVQKDFLLVARCLRKIREEMPTEFETVIALFRLSKRRAYYLLSLEKQLSNFNIPDDRLKTIGWTKLRLIAPHLTSNNVEFLLLLAQRYTGRELALKLHSQRIVKGEKSVLLYFTPKQYEIFTTALLTNGAMKFGNGIRGKESALIKALSAPYKKSDR